MTGSSKLPSYRWFTFLENAGIRVGVYTGLGLAVSFTTWLVIANRLAIFERFAMERNLGAAVVFAFFALLPILRFYGAPYDLVASGMIAWTMFCVTFWLLSFVFTLLEENYGAFHLFVLGALVYMISATLSWIGTIIWQVRVEHSSRIHH
jgi:hypothetical protein